MLEGEVIARAHRGAGLAVNDDLASRIVRGLQQYGVHRDFRRYAGRFGLHDLGAPHFGTIGGDRRVQRHVLRLERRNAQPVLGEDAAQARCEQALPRSRHRALHHDGLGGHESTSFMAATSAAFSASVRTATRYHRPSRPTKFSQRRTMNPRSSSGAYSGRGLSNMR